MVRVTIYNEFVHEREDESVKKVYPNGIHMTLKEGIEDEEISVTTVTLDEIETLTEQELEKTDVLIWWGHMRHEDVPDEVAKRVRDAVLGGMGAIFLHSSMHAKPFKLLMGTSCNVGWREDNDRELVWVVDASHPIANGIDRYILIPHEETYSEPFGIPEPDKTVFIGSFEGGEVFRSGCCWQRENGKVFYFQPGHETLPVYHQQDILRVIKNAVHWAKPDYRTQLTCPNIKKLEL